jgi:hypothetical protein
VSIQGGNATNEIGVQTVFDLAPGENTTLTFIWDTEGVPQGSHTVRAHAHPVPGETEFEDNYSGDIKAEIIISGDSNGDGAINVGDAVYLINHIFNYGPVPECP